MDPMVWDFLGVIVRWALTAAGAWLVGHHVLTASQSETYVTAFAHDLVIALPAIGGLAWGLWTRYHGRVKFLTALMPGVHTENQVNAILKSGAPTPTVTTPPNTVPGVPLPPTLPPGPNPAAPLGAPSTIHLKGNP
jgi:hypothetical protein